MEHAQLDEIDGAISLLFKKEEIGCLCLNACASGCSGRA
jgi:hypothetical protein